MANELHAQWGRTLKQLRNERGLKLRDMTSRTGLHKSHYCRIEAGEVNPGDDVRMKIAAAIGVRVEEIFTYPDPQAAAP